MPERSEEVQVLIVLCNIVSFARSLTIYNKPCRRGRKRVGPVSTPPTYEPFDALQLSQERPDPIQASRCFNCYAALLLPLLDSNPSSSLSFTRWYLPSTREPKRLFVTALRRPVVRW